MNSIHIDTKEGQIIEIAYINGMWEIKDLIKVENLLPKNLSLTTSLEVNQSQVELDYQNKGVYDQGYPWILLINTARGQIPNFCLREEESEILEDSLVDYLTNVKREIELI